MFTIENQGVNAYLVYAAQPHMAIDNISLGMISNNKIKGVLSALYTQMDESRYLKYNVSSKIPVSTIFKDKVSKQRLLTVLSGICEAIMSAEEYMIDQSLFVLDLDYIYIDGHSNEVEMVCLPVEDAMPQYSLQDFFRQIVCSAQVDFSENCEYIAKLISFLNSAQVFSVAEFRSFVDSLNVHSPVSVSYTPPAKPQEKPVPSQPASVVNTPVAAPAPAPVAAPAYASVPKTQPAPTAQALPPEIVQPEKKDKKKDKKKKEKEKPTAAVSGQPEEKQVTLFTLLTKYSKENVELYKAQKANKNSGASAKENKKAPKTQEPLMPGFAVPNQTSAAIPSAAVPAINNNVSAGAPASQPAKSKAPAHIPAPAQVYTPAPVAVKEASFGETVLLSKPGADMGDTTVLDVSQIRKAAAGAYLIREKNNEKIYINKPRFRIGKEKSYVDYFVADNTAISRSHADIITSGNEFFIVDMNSTNHTFVNNEMIASGSEVRLTNGDNIRLANETFTFKVN